ncbi:hypothetical protein [Borreliella californiensis]
MQKYLDELEKNIKIIVKLSFKNNPTSIIYYKINCPFEKIGLKIQDYYQSLSEKVAQLLQKNPTTI